MIYDAERIASAMVDRPDGPRAFLLAYYPRAPIPDERERDRRTEPLPAIVNHSVWIVVCPCEATGEPAPGMVVWLARPWLWCVRCQNGATDGRWRRVAVPPGGRRAAIEAVLDCRPEPTTRNWQPGETLDDLIRENVEHGDPVPERRL